MTHEQLCAKARAWLRGTRRCNPVFSNCASCDEIPDAIGWSTRYGSTVVECKTSVSDFYAEKKKKFMYEDPKWGIRYSAKRFNAKQAKELDYKLVELTRMGDYRFYMCEAGLLDVELIQDHAPDHGLLWVKNRIVQVVRQAVKRPIVDKDSEIRYLRFVIINDKNRNTDSWNKSAKSGRTAEGIREAIQ